MDGRESSRSCEKKGGGTYGNAALRTPTLSMMSMKQKELSENRPIFANSHAIENKRVIKSRQERQKENAGGKYEGMFRDVVENTCRKNVWFRPFRDIIENKALKPSLP
jgi:hypothetical protein